MAILKATYTRKGGTAKASVRYIENRPGKEGARVVRTLFNADGKVGRADVYTMIDQADKNSYFFRLVISPDPKREDSDKNLSLREITERTIQSLEDRFQKPLQWVAAVHADHTDTRHIHAIAIVPERLNVQDFQRMRSAATEEALEQRRHLDLSREARERSQEQSEGLGLELSW
ncbi:MAG: hypothetical protein ACJ8LM_15640 [Candidatus Udaeobacter sp.]